MGKLRSIIYLAILFTVVRVQAVDLEPAFTYQGRFTNSAGAPLMGVIGVRFQIFSADGKCLLYEESQSVELSEKHKGVASLKVGSFIGSSKRTAKDPQLKMKDIFSNSSKFAATANCAGGFSPLAGDARWLRVFVNNEKKELMLSPDQIIASVPTALVAETLQGLTLGDLDKRYVLGNRLMNLEAGKFCYTDGETIKCDKTLQSLQGPKGDTGAAGPQGLAGIQGPAGPQGPKGEKGDVGLQGPPGKDALQPAKGDKGDQGIAGKDGAQGPKGDKGDQGIAGKDGAQGPKGDKGDQGIAGKVGAQGPKGDKGDQGYTGPQGPAGPQGPRGIQGERGIAGVAGPQGPAGPAGADPSTRIICNGIKGNGVLGDVVIDFKNRSDTNDGYKKVYLCTNRNWVLIVDDVLSSRR